MQILDFVFPRECFGCKKPGTYLCNSCVAEFEIRKPLCAICDRPAMDGLTHPRCSKPYGIDGLITLWEYHGAIRKLLLALKYKFAHNVGKDLFRSFVSTLKKEGLPTPRNTVVIPIPLHWYRQNWRGFNQVSEISKLFCESLNYKFGESILVRKSARSSQASLSREDRLKNMRGIFILNPKVNKAKLRNMNVILFDDVYTTGSTMKEAAKVLKRAGVGKVWGLTVAR